ncbi:type II secretion system F family protein [Spirillospora sp. NPDC047279]|uniref:type II secretion system F family protein n=1 Tax=Spirillospora sp. NPDC047279 TaxID=3155478 RepID=UPI0033C0DB1F
MDSGAPDMIGVTESASLCAAAAIWVLMGPRPAAHRLSRIRQTRPPTNRLPSAVKTWIAGLKERRRLEQLWRTTVIELCDGMAAELAAGRTPEEAFTTAAAVLDRRIATELSPPDQREEALVADHLDLLSTRPGAEGLRLLAACWRIGAERGGTLATVLDGLASALRDEEAQRQEIAAQLAGPRATARLLAGLPVLGLGMAAALGTNPLAFLFGTIPGAACLAVGVTLDAAGLGWTRRLAKAAEVPR